MANGSIDNELMIAKLAIASNNNIHIVDLNNVIRCESSNNYTFIHLNDQPKILTAKTLKSYEQLLLKHGFVRVHQCHLVNMQYVKSVEMSNGLLIRLLNDDTIPVSYRKKETVLKYIQTAFIC